MAACKPRSVRGLARFFAPSHIADKCIVWKVSRLRIENPGLERETRSVGQDDAMLDADLRRPSPQVSGIGERGSGECREGCGSKRGEKQMVLPGDNRSLGPIQPNRPRAQA